MKKETAADRKHVYYFDRLRVIACFCVVLMHVAATRMRLDITKGWIILDLFVSFAFCAVPLFFMMSGYLLLNSKKTSDVSFVLKKRIPRLVLPIAVWTVASILFNTLPGNLSLGSFKENVLSALSNASYEAHLWYLYVLVVLTLISPVLRGGMTHLDGRGRKYVFAIIAVIVVHSIITKALPSGAARYLNIETVSRINLLGGDLAAFLLGYLLGTSKKRVPNAVLIAGAIVILTAITAGTYFKSVQAGEYVQTFQDQHGGYEIALASCIFLLFKQNFDRESRVLKVFPVVPLTMGIYLSHIYVIYGAKRMGIVPSTLADTFIMTAAVFAISYIAVKTLATIPVVCYISTGLKFSDACGSCNWIYTFKRVFKKNK